MEMKTEDASDDMTEFPCDSKPTTGIAGIF